MDAAALELDVRGRGVEVFKFDFAKRPAVDGIAEIGAQLGDAEALRTAADFLVRREGDAELAVANFRMLEERSASVRISATPALSSAPSSVVPSVTIRSLPDSARKRGKVGRPHDDVLFGV